MLEIYKGSYKSINGMENCDFICDRAEVYFC